MFLAKLENGLVVLVEHFNRRRHEATNDDKLLATRVPREVMNWTLFSLDGGDFVFLIVVYEEAELPIVGLPCWVEIGLKLHEELVGDGAEFYFNLLRFLDVFAVQRLFVRFVSENFAFTLIGLLVQVNRGQEELGPLRGR